MPKHLIVASTPDQAHPRYFLGYRDDCEANEGLWTLDPWRATWFGADEAAVETILLALLCPGLHVQSWSVSTAGMSKPR